MSHTEIRTYDVWGNEKDGFEVNNVYHYGEYDKVVFNNDLDVLKFLNKHFFAKPQTRRSIFIDMSHENRIYVEIAKNGEPLCEIVEAID